MICYGVFSEWIVFCLVLLIKKVILIEFDNVDKIIMWFMRFFFKLNCDFFGGKNSKGYLFLKKVER